MQYPPEPRSMHSASEIYGPYYPSTMPGQEGGWPPMQSQEIVVYPNKTLFILRIVICGIVFVFGLLLFITLATPFLLFLHALAARYVIAILAYLIFLLILIVVAGWATWRLSRFVFKPAPLLIINHHGITVGKLPALSSFFIPWHEIEAIYIHTFINKYLCIRPKDTRKYMQRFKFLERLYRQSNAIGGVSPLFIAQISLARPLKEIMPQLQYFYAQELQTHHIELHH